MRHKFPARSGLTLIELLLSICIMTMLVVALGGMASGIYRGNEYSEGYGLATQHARVVLDRIHRTVSKATANELFPGALVLEETVAGFRFPDTLVVWNPSGEPLDKAAGPRMNEIVVFCANPNAPNELWEITQPNSTAALPAANDTVAWRTTIDALKANNSTNKVVLTDLLRVAVVAEAAGNAAGRRRGCVRFGRRVLPSEADWDAYLAAQNESATWAALVWPQSIRGSQTGVRQTWIRTELQLMPGEVAAHTSNAMPAAPFFGSAALYYEMNRR